MKREKFFQSYRHAVNGLKRAASEERNFRTELGFAVLALILSVVLNVSVIEFAIVLLCCAFVLGAELTNSALERVVDYVSPEFHELAKASKDMAAGAVLISAIGAALVGACIFVPKLIELIVIKLI